MWLQDAASARIAGDVIAQHARGSPDHHAALGPVQLPEAVGQLLPISLWSGQLLSCYCDCCQSRLCVIGFRLAESAGPPKISEARH